MATDVNEVDDVDKPIKKVNGDSEDKSKCDKQQDRKHRTIDDLREQTKSPALNLKDIETFLNITLKQKQEENQQNSSNNSNNSGDEQEKKQLPWNLTEDVLERGVNAILRKGLRIAAQRTFETVQLQKKSQVQQENNNSGDVKAQEQNPDKSKLSGSEKKSEKNKKKGRKRNRKRNRNRNQQPRDGARRERERDHERMKRQNGGYPLNHLDRRSRDEFNGHHHHYGQQHNLEGYGHHQNSQYYRGRSPPHPDRIHQAPTSFNPEKQLTRQHHNDFLRDRYYGNNDMRYMYEENVRKRRSSSYDSYAGKYRERRGMNEFVGEGKRHIDERGRRISRSRSFGRRTSRSPSFHSNSSHRRRSRSAEQPHRRGDHYNHDKKYDRIRSRRMDRRKYRSISPASRDYIKGVEHLEYGIEPRNGRQRGKRSRSRSLSGQRQRKQGTLRSNKNEENRYRSSKIREKNDRSRPRADSYESHRSRGTNRDRKRRQKELDRHYRSRSRSINDNRRYSRSRSRSFTPSVSADRSNTKSEDKIPKLVETSKSMRNLSTSRSRSRSRDRSMSKGRDSSSRSNRKRSRKKHRREKRRRSRKEENGY